MSNFNEQKFENKYKFSEADKQLLVFSKANKDIISSQVTGKPSKLFFDVVKRFFKNKVAVFSLVILLAIILTAVISWAVSPNQTDKPISSASSVLVNELRPSFQGEIEYSISTEILDKILKTNPTLIKNTPVNIAPDTWMIKANPYEILTELSKPENAKPGDVVKPIVAFMGTDSYGRDIWLRAWVGTLNALGVAFSIAIIETFIGVVIGSYLGFHVGKKVDTWGVRLIEIFSSIPWVIIFIILIGIFGTSWFSIIWIFAITGWTGAASSTRQFTIIVKDEEYIYASQAIGASKLRLIFTHILPATAGKLANSFVLRITAGIQAVAAVAFLGFLKEGVDSTPNLGLLITNSATLINQNPWALVFPSLILLVLSLSLRFIALGFHDALDPKIIKKGA
ncbi:ABC transporter permease [Mesomycoplasma lagogenitalium]|uniref:ABC transporter permease n=1 Tax=Mesomycoplasma lagogenitalium TaxID=171286 RepID=A0ABY8LUB6_9BACT|nr:ABC transporter permease [Mesomycoplasma lagogenitalium]WGI36834.1 ABC transporter permease [Mesomycoplasma lagogenitalium]